MITDDKSVLLSHGGPGTSDDFHLVRNLLPANIQVIAPDLTGFGEAFNGTLPTHEATADTHAESQ